MYELNIVNKKLPDEKYLFRHFKQLLLPTELVYRGGELPPPRYARAYSTNLWNPKGTSNIVSTGQYQTHESVYLLEYFENWGDDGHTDYCLKGWVFVAESALTPDFYTNYHHYSSFLTFESAILDSK